MSNRNTSYTASSALVCTLASLASDSALVTGRESTLIDNSTILALDYFVSGKITTGTSPSAGTIEVWCVPELDDTTWPDVFDGADSAETAASRDMLVAMATPVWSVPTSVASNTTYYMPKKSIAALFGGVCPRKFVLFVTHNTGVNLNSTAGTHALYQQPVFETIA